MFHLPVTRTNTLQKRVVSGIRVSQENPQALLLMRVATRRVTSWLIPCLGCADCRPVLVLADTVDLSIRHQGVSGNDTGQAPPRVCFTCDAQLFRLSLFVFNNCCQISGANAVPWVRANTNGANHKISDLESPTPD